MPEIYNLNPTVFATKGKSRHEADQDAGSMWLDEYDPMEAQRSEELAQDIDPEEIFDLVRLIKDPEHPLTLEQLAVVSAAQVQTKDNYVRIEFTPTVPHCGMSTVIGLCIRVRLLQNLPPRYKVDIEVKPGSHQSEVALNKQLNDKERVAAAMENPTLLSLVEQCLAGT